MPLFITFPEQTYRISDTSTIVIIYFHSGNNFWKSESIFSLFQYFQDD
jgi:hypothetical protein